MLLLGTVTFCIAIPLCYNTVNAFHYTRLAVIIFLMSVLLTIGVINMGVEDISIYCSLVFQSDRTLFMEVLLFMVGSLCLITFHPKSDKKGSKNSNHISSTVIGTYEQDAVQRDTFEDGSSMRGYKVLRGKDEGNSVRGVGGEGNVGYTPSDTCGDVEGNTIPKEYSLVVIFSVIGASIILSSYNLISIYLATELQSFALYIIAALSRDSLRSVQASLKYFILGA